MDKIKVLFFGTPVFSAVGLRSLIESPRFEVSLVITQPDRPAGRGKKLQASPVKQLAQEHNIAVVQPPSIRKKLGEFLSDMNRFGSFDIGVVSAFGQILPSEVLEFPQRGCVNIHASLLPRWRGAAPIQRAIMAGDTRSGVCLMRMEAGLDTGPVFSTASVEIESTETAATLHDKLAHLGAELLIKDLPQIAAGKLEAMPQAEDGVTYAHKITKDEARINWNTDGKDLERLIRGLNPFPGAFTTLGGKRLKLYLAKYLELPAQTDQNTAGAVTQNDHELVVQCGTGGLKLLEVQLEGKKRMSTEDFLRSVSLETGTILGKE